MKITVVNHSLRGLEAGLIDERARCIERKDYTRSDEIRDILRKQYRLVVEDSPGEMTIRRAIIPMDEPLPDERRQP